MPFKGTLKTMSNLIAEEKWTPPEWAIWQRLLFDTMNQAALERKRKGI